MDSLRTIDLARAVGMSVQQVRNYEAFGFLPSAERSPAGYRLYTARHLAALRTARVLIAGYGWQEALAVMQAVHGGDLEAVLALVDSRHAALDRQRHAIDQTLFALQSLAADSNKWCDVAREPAVTAGVAAKRVGVRVSALRFWEQQGLLTPSRDPRNRYRVYDRQQRQRLQIIVHLRAIGHRFEAIRLVLKALEEGRPEKAIDAVAKRREAVQQASKNCLAATARLWEYLATNAAG